MRREDAREKIDQAPLGNVYSGVLVARHLARDGEALYAEKLREVG